MDIQNYKDTVLHCAAEYNRLNIVQLLIEVGADLAVTDGNGKTPLERAVDNSHLDVVYYLVAKCNQNISKFSQEYQAKINSTVAEYVKAHPEVKKKVPNYHVLIELLEKVVDWKTVATHLLKDEDGSKIKGIEMTYHHDVEDCRAEMIRLYLKSGNVSWQNILSALRKSKYSNLADDIERNI
ncbi:CARD- and ANK-domain containing inflammasome adapter protein-like [Dysidea avara]|uniref:CARD- and ANK-domain containing inflammasome adapter protein-like n=1 Tax=Dysidea avara TaxID=196820 RepID=UPI00331E7B04